MEVLLNDTPIALGSALPDVACDQVGLRRPGLLQRVLSRDSDSNRFEAENCTLSAMDGAFSLYPCTHGYLTPDRQWRTAASIFMSGDVVQGVMIEVIEGRYSAAEFIDRFHQVCDERFGDAHIIDRFTKRWRNGKAYLTSCLQPDGKNATFLIELIDPV